MKSKLKWLLELLYPRFCYSCDKMGEFLCDRCYNKLEFLLNSNLLDEVYKLEQDWDRVWLKKLDAAVIYDDLVAKMMHQYKYLGVKELSSTFAYWIYQFAPVEQPDVITYIPIHQNRLKERGYNQAKLIAESLAAKYGVACLPLLKRTVDRVNQARSKNKAERKQKAADIFAVQSPVIAGLDRQQHILIIDDVITTGATINEAARMLRLAGFENVHGVAVAHGDS